MTRLPRYPQYAAIHVGIDTFDCLESKLKTSQDETMQDRLGTVRGLREDTSEQTGSMTGFVMKAIEPDATG